MKKSLLYAFAALSLVLTGCGRNDGPSSSSTSGATENPTSAVSENPTTQVSENPTTQVSENPTSVTSADSTSGTSTPSGTVIRHDSWERVLEYDYSNVTIGSVDSYLSTPSYVYILDEGKYVNSYDIGGQMVHQFFADYNGENYVYWDKLSSEGVGKDGWINYNAEYEVDLSLGHQDFYLPALLNYITEDDVEYNALFSAFFVKDSSLSKFAEKVVPFGYDHHIQAVTIQVRTDSKGYDYIEKIWCFDDIEKGEDGPYMMFQFFNYGQTTSPTTKPFPEMPTEQTIYDYWTITGKEYTPKVFPSQLTIAAQDNGKVEDGYDIVLDIGESIEVYLTVGPENVNREGIYEWTPDANSFKDNDGNASSEFYDQVALFHFKSCNKTKTEFLTARKAGEVEIYVTHFYPGEEDVVSNKLKVKVLEEKEQELNNAVYNFEFTGYQKEYNDYEWGEQSGYYQTTISATNKVSDYNPDFEITSFKGTLLEGSYTDAFEDVDKVLSLSPTSGVTNDGLDTYVDFNFGDQKVSSISFKYSLHRSGQLQYAKNNLKEAALYTSNDGVNWSKATNYKDKWLKSFGEASSNVSIQSWLQETTFAEAQYVRLLVSGNQFGQHFSVVIANMIFSAEHRTHVEKPFVPVTSVNITGSSQTVRMNNEIEFTSNVLPEEATNKKVYWSSSDHSIATVTPHKDGSVTVKGLKVGTCKIKVITDAENGEGKSYTKEMIVTVIGAAVIPDSLNGKSYFKSAGENYLAVKFDKNTNTAFFSLIKSGIIKNETIALYEEQGGIYDFKSSNSRILIKVNEDNTITIGDTSSITSNLYGISLTSLGFTTLNLAEEQEA